jgi:cytochrome c oxidase cbb3-type subunit 3
MTHAPHDDGRPPLNTPKEVTHDGIVEFDNDPPLWLTATFILSMLFGVWYALNYHLSVSAKLGPDDWQVQMAALAELRASKDTGPLDEAAMLSLSTVPERITRGAELYAANECHTCHAADGTSDAIKTGPNLRDRYWIHGSSMEAIANVIRAGASGGAMPAQGGKLSNQDIANLTIFLVNWNRQGEKTGKAVNLAIERETPIKY